MSSTNSAKNFNQKYYNYITSCQKIKGILGVSTTLTGGVSAETILDNLKD